MLRKSVLPPEQVGQHAMHDGGADLAFDVVADDRQVRRFEPRPPFGARGEKDRNAVDEAAARFQRLLGIEMRCAFAADRQVGNDDVGAAVAQGARHVDRRVVRLFDRAAQIFAQPVQGRAALHVDAQPRHRGKADRVVGGGEHRLAEIAPDLRRGDVERGGELDVADAVSTDFAVHQARHAGFVIDGAIELNALHQRRCAIADTHQCDADFVAAQRCPRFVFPFAKRQVQGKFPAPDRAAR
jgi:hypothetical protein